MFDGSSRRSTTRHVMMTMQSAMIVVVLTTLTLTLTHGAPTLTLTPATLPHSGGYVTVSWSGVSSPSKSDYLGLYAPATNPDSYDYGRYQATNASSWATGSGSFKMGPFPNMRVPISIRYVGAGGSSVASALLAPPPQDEPTGLHLAYGASEDEMVVMWTTGHGVSTPVVKYGVSPQDLTSAASAVTRSYGVGDMCEAPANSSRFFLDPGAIHVAVMDGLEAGKVYYYSVGSDGGLWSGIESFVANIAPGKGSDVRMAVYGDLGVAVPFTIHQEQQPQAANTLKWVGQYNPSMVYHNGDISYARGYAFLWEYYMQLNTMAVAAKYPYHVSIGNHEWDFVNDYGSTNPPRVPWRPSWTNYGTDSGGECGVPYVYRMVPTTDPIDPSSMDDLLYYDLVHGNVHLIVLSSETDFVLGSSQYAWFKSTLESKVNRTVTPWVVVALHRPLFSSSKGMLSSPMVEHFRTTLTPLLEAHGVDLVLGAHVHKYSRTTPITYASGSPRVAPQGYPVYIDIGMAGHNFQNPWENIPGDPNHYNIPDFVVFRTSTFGWCSLETSAADGTLTFTYRGDQSDEIHDQLILRLESQEEHRRLLHAQQHQGGDPVQ